MKNVQIIYCYDKDKNPVHYLKTKREDKYHCIDCGTELVYREGKIKQKHLAHKNTINCGGTGESIFHKHWKENLFKEGMFIDVVVPGGKPKKLEIVDVMNEVSLKKRYNKNWDKDIIVDTLLVTKEGDIVVEINYKNKKDWDKLKPYYKQLNLVAVYEVTVGRSVNEWIIWNRIDFNDNKNEIEMFLKELNRLNREFMKVDFDFYEGLGFTSSEEAKMVVTTNGEFLIVEVEVWDAKYGGKIVEDVYGYGAIYMGNDSSPPVVTYFAEEYEDLLEQMSKYDNIILQVDRIKNGKRKVTI